MNLLHEILKAELAVADAEIAADKLRQKYADENREFLHREMVEVLSGYANPVWIRARVTHAEFRTDPCGIVYTVIECGPMGENRVIVKKHRASGANIRKVYPVKLL